jgi:hypothetical protein
LQTGDINSRFAFVASSLFMSLLPPDQSVPVEAPQQLQSVAEQSLPHFLAQNSQLQTQNTQMHIQETLVQVQTHHENHQGQVMPLHPNVQNSHNYVVQGPHIPDISPLTEQDGEESATLINQILEWRTGIGRFRKATFWSFFRTVGQRPTTNGEFEELLACRLCRPDVLSTESWEAACRPRTGLARYVARKGTSTMSTHVKLHHSVTKAAVEHALCELRSTEKLGSGIDATEHIDIAEL